MAIDSILLSLLRQAVQNRSASLSEPRPLTMLALAFPDLLVPRPLLEQILGPQIFAKLKLIEPEKAAPILAWHGIAGANQSLYDTASLFEALGLDVTVTDIVEARGGERIVDLNQPLPGDLCRRFDLVFDTGTLEHCFNVGMAFRNACEALCVGGLLVHAAPLNRINHGFWNFNPTVYPDYFEDNGFALRFIEGAEGNPSKGHSQFKVEPFKRFAPPPNAALYVVAERMRLQDPVWPVQRKYRSLKA